MTDNPNPSAGWYPAPHANGEQRYWDGTAWADPVKRKGFPWWAWVLVAVVAVGLVGGVASAVNGGRQTAAEPVASVSVTEEPVAEPVAEEPAEPEEPAYTLAQQNAIRSAESYLQVTAFSRTGLIGQLEYEGFSTEDATFAVDTVEVDWDEQAAKSAEAYLAVSSFSRDSLLDQLIFEGFTPEQAEYGVIAVGY